MNSDNTVAASLVTGVLTAAESMGLDAPACMKAAAIDESALRSPTSRVAFTSFTSLLRFIQEITGDAGVGLRIGRELALSSYNALGYAAANGETLFDAVLLLPEYESLVVSLANTEVVELGPSVEVRWSMTGGQYFAMLEGLFFASWATLGELLANRCLLNTAVHFTHEAPEDLDMWEATFGPSILFDQPVAKVVFSRSTLALPVCRSDPFMYEVMTKEAEYLKAAINGPSLVTRVATWLTQQLPQGEPDQKSLACHLNMSERTLRRRLQRENVSYQLILDRVRMERATYYLAQTSLPIQEIATLLGYQHLTAFNAAYKRWMGTTPGRARSETATQK
ncbi:HTH-type transcriptional regulator VirS [Halioglobus japonicus]|nr:HTH-type transcriptional regulator VirS [Halioglobus japonicus]